MFAESLVEGGASGFGNIDADPQFIASPADLRIPSTSPARDASTLSAAPIDQRRRPRDAVPDLGALEAEPP